MVLLRSIEGFSYLLLQSIIYSIPTFICTSYALWKALLICLGAKIIFNPHKKRLEMEADKVGFQLSAKSCIDLREVLVLWEIMETYSDFTKKSKYQIPFIMMHPTHKSRERRLAIQMLKALELQKEAGCPDLPIMDDGIRRSLQRE
ncbi:metalloendopeptidase OMA1, mitochondrial-like [Colletes latitarsis]|uniref:metalloendopeptidase OMA1, mitochondrial-like n=1 Tax=Colletes latitarsis TaxID=2605962 RepID=UPI004037590C